MSDSIVNSTAKSVKNGIMVFVFYDALVSIIGFIFKLALTLIGGAVFCVITFFLFIKSKFKKEEKEHLPVKVKKYYKLLLAGVLLPAVREADTTPEVHWSEKMEFLKTPIKLI